MGKNKRKNDDTSNTNESFKRARPSLDKQKSITYGRVDPTYGQRSAIPGLDDYNDGEAGSDDEDADLEHAEIDADALSYLRAVRLEAQGIPTLLVAPSQNERSLYDDGIGDTRGYYKDGAYTAAPVEGSISSEADLESSGEGGRDPQVVYFEKILERFENMREILSAPPPRYVVERLDNDHGMHMGGGTADYGMWRWRLGHTEPLPAQLASMDKSTVLRLLRLITGGKNLLSSEGISGRTSRWVWGLLARLPERGELSSEEIGVVRELGKRAVWVGVAMRGVDMGGLDGGEDDEEEEVVDAEIDVGDEMQDGDDDAAPTSGPVLPAGTSPDGSQLPPGTSSEDIDGAPDDDIGIDEAFAAAKARLMAQLTEKPDDFEIGIDIEIEPEIIPEKTPAKDPPREELEDPRNAKATVDMIITVAGEIYGQRDLLEFRDVWE